MVKWRRVIGEFFRLRNRYVYTLLLSNTPPFNLDGTRTEASCVRPSLISIRVTLITIDREANLKKEKFLSLFLKIFLIVAVKIK